MSRGRKKNKGAPKPTVRRCAYCGAPTTVSPYAQHTRLRRYQHHPAFQTQWPPLCFLGKRSWQALLRMGWFS